MVVCRWWRWWVAIGVDGVGVDCVWLVMCVDGVWMGADV